MGRSMQGRVSAHWGVAESLDGHTNIQHIYTQDILARMVGRRGDCSWQDATSARPGHGSLSQNAGPFGGLGHCKRDLFPSSTRRSAAPPNGTEGCATEVAQAKEDRGRRKKRGEERGRKIERKREYGGKKNVIHRRYT